MRSKRGVLVAVVALLTAVAVTTPAIAKPGGGSPGGSGLDVSVEPRGVFMWANSVGDQILFDIVVTNTSRGDLSDVTVAFSDTHLITLDLAKNERWNAGYVHTVVDADFAEMVDGTSTPLPLNTQTEVTAGIVSATAGAVSDSAPAVMTAYPVPPCEQDAPGNAFTFTTADDYSLCSFAGTGAWTLTTTLIKPPRGKSNNPSATVRDGVPGNWCRTGESVVEGMVVIDYQFLPDDGECLVGGAGGDPIPVRNRDTFYLTTWKGNVVEAAPEGSGG